VLTPRVDPARIITHMSIGRVMRRRLAAVTVPLAFVAALPLVQWCPLGSEATLLDCLAVGAAPVPDAAPQAPAACAGGHGGCGAAAATCDPCPSRRSKAPARCIGAPLGGPGLRPLSPALRPPAVQVALVDAPPPVVEAPGELGLRLARAGARPPTRSWARRPPVRGPPLG
jgi:hypothetical protein